jgi:2-polyprenyl-3-methyl-5-hydroxy-6-metoxy-1,4-benzoquinol methylase
MRWNADAHEEQCIDLADDRRGAAASSEPLSQAEVKAFYDARVALAAKPKRGFSGWLERRDTAAVLRLLRPADGGSALDVGCGHGIHARALKQAGMVVCAMDLVPNLVELVRPLVDEAIVADLATLALQRTFDRVLCFGVLEYMPDPLACVGNLARHVAPGGRLVVQVPRRSVGGRVYQWGYRRLNGIQVGLFSATELDAAVAAHDLRSDGREPTFVHNMVLAWSRGGAARAA